MSGPDDRGAHSPGDEGRAPLFGHWSGWYAVLIVELIAVILFCGWLAAKNG